MDGGRRGEGRGEGKGRGWSDGRGRGTTWASLLFSQLLFQFVSISIASTCFKHLFQVLEILMIINLPCPWTTEVKKPIRGGGGQCLANHLPDQTIIIAHWLAHSIFPSIMLYLTMLSFPNVGIGQQIMLISVQSTGNDQQIILIVIQSTGNDVLFPLSYCLVG